MTADAIFPEVVTLLWLARQAGGPADTAERLGGKLTTAETHALRIGLDAVLRDAQAFDSLFNIFLTYPDAAGGTETELDPRLSEEILEQGLANLRPEQLVELASTPVWLAELSDAIKTRRPGYWREAGGWSEHPSPATGGRDGAEGELHDVTVRAPWPSPFYPGRSASWRYWVGLTVAATLLAAVGTWFLALPPRPSPPTFAARDVPADGSLGPGGGPGSARVIRWSVPSDMDEYVAVLEVSPDGVVEVRPLRDAVCQRVEPRLPGAEVELTLLFRPPPRGDKVVWLILTDRPAAEALRSSVESAAPGGDLRGPQYPRPLFEGLHAAGVTARAVGRVVLTSATVLEPPQP